MSPTRTAPEVKPKPDQGSAARKRAHRAVIRAKARMQREYPHLADGSEDAG
jgi:hypothetical protein